MIPLREDDSRAFVDEEIARVRRPSRKVAPDQAAASLAGQAKSCISALSAPVGG
jgi:hypothetical protein